MDLKDELKSKDARVRARARQQLMRSDTEMARETLLELLGERDGGVRADALLGLTCIMDFHPMFEDWLVTDPDERVRIAAMMGISPSTPSGLRVLRIALEDPAPKVVQMAAASIASLGSERADQWTKWIEPLRTHPDPDTREWIEELLEEQL